MTTFLRDQSSDFSTPGSGNGMLDVFRYRYLLRLLVRKGILTRYHGSVLGWTWSYVKPAAQFLTFYLVMGVFLDLNRGIENFAVYLFSGIVVVNLFSEAFGNATRSIVDNAPLVKKIYLPRELFPLAAVFVAFVHFLPQLVILMIAAVFTGWSPVPLQIVGGLVAIFIVLAISTGLGLLFGAVNVSFRDAQNVVELILLFATWTSPVLYSWTMVRDATPTWLFDLYMLNPLTAAVELFHDAFWLSTTEDGASRPENLAVLALTALLVSLSTLLIGQLVFRKLEGRFAQDL
ncbi:ABC transporter permease [Microcella daejeonensis]|uniref:Transport permease protein n=1 Tax=Microcella daejeonensis TaxID=2994971 RepID=A0A9E8MLL0_9MICO|nr:ABC transporter permease [Microcella daejeonensis]WAB81868.1 ABC transporter permease [Microcella daejeonensis]